MNPKPSRIALLIATASLAAVAGQADAAAYRSVELGMLSGPNSAAFAINNAGQVVGRSDVLDESGSTQHATLWDKTRTVDLELGSGYTTSTATGINNAGQIVGTGSDRSGSYTSLWNGTQVANQFYGPRSDSAGINNAGAVAGQSDYGSPQLAAVWQDGDMSRLDNLPGSGYNEAVAINDANQVVGYATTSSEWRATRHAVRWDGAEATDLGTLGGDGSSAYDINNAGQAVGTAQGADNVYRAAIWNGGTIRDLGTLGSGDYRATAINEAGLVVGSFNTGAAGDVDAYHAILWNGGAMLDLNSLLDPGLAQAGWVLTEATGINDHGDIVGNMRNRYTNLQHGVLLSAVPEADTYAMLLAGLGLLGCTARRRKAAQAPRPQPC
jgi:probable HAF family extracellular repeat protein